MRLVRKMEKYSNVESNAISVFVVRLSLAFFFITTEKLIAGFSKY